MKTIQREKGSFKKTYKERIQMDSSETLKYDMSYDGMTYSSPGNYNMAITLDIDANWGCIPEKVIYNGATTICVFSDGVKITARPTEDDDFDKEVGVAMCIMKRIFGSRSEFQRVVEKGYEQNKKKVEEHESHEWLL